MIDAYRIGVKIAMTNGVSAVLAVIQRDVLGLKKHVDMTTGSFDKMKLAVAGAAGVTVGAGILAGLYKMSEAAENYTDQLNIMRMAGLNQVEIAQATAAAWGTSNKILTTDVTGNLKAIIDMKNSLTGGLPEAIKMLPITMKIATVMAASSDSNVRGNADDIAFSVAKAMDIMGYNTGAEMEHGASRMSQVVAAFQNRITPDAIASTTFYARQARYDMDDMMRWGVVPSMMLERAGGGGGGGSKGIGPSLAAVNRMAVVGTMTKKTAEWFQNLGLLHGAMSKTTTTGVQTKGLDDQKLWASNAFFATWKDLVPSLQKKYGASIIDDPAKLRAAIAGSGMTQTAMSQIMEWVTKPGNVLRDAQNVGVLPDLGLLPPLLKDIATKLGLDPTRGAMPYNQAYDEAAKNSPRAARMALGKQWETLETAIGKAMTPSVVAGINKMASGLAYLGKVVNDHPNATKWILGTAAALGVVLVVAGTVAIAVAAVGAIIGSTAALIAGGIAAGLVVVGGLALGIYKYWDQIKAFTSNITGWISGVWTLALGIYKYWDQIKAFTSNITGWISGVWTKAATWFATHDLAAMALKGLASVSAAIMTWISNLLGAVWNFVKHPLGGSDAPSAAPGVAQTIANGYAPAGGFGPPPSRSYSMSGFLTDGQAAHIGGMVAEQLNGMVLQADGKEIAKMVFKHVDADAYNPPSGTSIFDSRQSPSFANFPGR